MTAARAQTRRCNKKARRFARRASFRLTYKIELSQDPPHTDRPMVVMVQPGGGEH